MCNNNVHGTKPKINEQNHYITVQSHVVTNTHRVPCLLTSNNGMWYGVEYKIT